MIGTHGTDSGGRRLLRSPWLALWLSAALLAGCGGPEGKAAPSQVAARVGGDEISIHQVNNLLARIPGVTPENLDKARREVLDRLVDQQLAVRKAVELKLDRSPQVLMAVESARREVLARAFLDQMLSRQPQVDESLAKQYFADHPELFAQRRVYELQELAIQTPGVPTEPLRQLAAAGKSLEEIAAALEQQQVAFVVNGISRSAEQLPAETLGRLRSVKDGETTVLELPARGVFVIHVAASRAAPVSEADALPRIRQYLAGQQAAVAAHDELEKLKAQVGVEYLGEFAAAAPVPRIQQVRLDADAAGVR